MRSIRKYRILIYILIFVSICMILVNISKFPYQNNFDKILLIEKSYSILNVTTKPCIIDNWLRFDPSASSYPRYVFCDELAEKSDILCRWYLHQKNIRDHLTCLLPLDGYKVPNIVFYLSFSRYKFLIENYLCVLSAKKIQKPSAIYIIGDLRPTGQYWDKLLQDVPEIRYIHRQLPRKISESPVKWPAHASDITRLQILYANGGIYMDTDEIFVKSFNPLRNINITMGIVDKNTGMGNAVIVAEKHSSFLQKLYNNYKAFNGTDYYANSLQAAYKLWQSNSSAVHLETDNLYRPSWFEDDLLFLKTGYVWQTKYAIHTWSKRNQHRMPKSFVEIDNWNTSLGEIYRYIYYNDARLRSVVLNKLKKA